MKKILLLGSNSQLSKEIEKELKFKKIKILKISKNNINFESKSSGRKLNKFLSVRKPDYIVVCIGIFENNNANFLKIFNVNCKPAWELIRYYIINNTENVKIMFIGSSAYNKRRKNYILYTASKTSLNSIANSAKDLFKKTNIKINIINPPAMKSKMRKNFFRKNNNLNSNVVEIEPTIIAKDILKKLKL